MRSQTGSHADGGHARLIIPNLALPNGFYTVLVELFYTVPRGGKKKKGRKRKEKGKDKRKKRRGA
jgi:hypothetical protein